MFTTLHSLFETQYMEFAGAVDEIAERIRALGATAPGSFTQFMERAAVKEDTGIPTAKDMIDNLVSDQEILAASARRVVREAEADSDEATADLAVTRILVRQKSAWMLRSHLE